MNTIRRGFSKPNLAFSYSLQRRYPFRFFTRSITLVLVILFALFTVFNIAANGYDLQPVFTTDPNTTLAQRQWFHSPVFTFGDDKLNPKCQSRDLAVGTQFLTTNLGFSYTVSGLLDADDNRLPSIPYMNNTLDDCEIREITLSLEKQDDSQPGRSQWWSWGKSYARVVSRCSIATSSGVYRADFTNYYGMPLKLNEYAPPSDRQRFASAWWGRQLLGRYWYGVQMSMGQGNGTGSPDIATGEFVFSAKDRVKSMNELDVFSAKYQMMQSDGGIDYQGIRDMNYTQFFNNDKFIWSQSLTEGLSFAKMFFSLILVDVGQTSTPNWLLDEDSLRAAVQSPFNKYRSDNRTLCNENRFDSWRACNMSAPVSYPTKSKEGYPMRESYDLFRNYTGPLGTRRATIYSQYTCTVPIQKSIGTVVWTTIIANFVLLQAAYTIIMFIADQILVGRDPTAMYCDGCLSPQGSHLLSNMTPSLKGYSQSRQGQDPFADPPSAGFDSPLIGVDSREGGGKLHKGIGLLSRVTARPIRSPALSSHPSSSSTYTLIQRHGTDSELYTDRDDRSTLR